MSRNKGCRGQRQTIVAITAFLLVALFMMFMQLYSDSVPDYPGNCGTLTDFGFKVFPALLNYSWLADVWVLVSILIFLVYAIWTSELAVRRFFWQMAIIFFFRALIVPVTRYPGLPINTDRYRPDNWLAGALLVLLGVHQTATDMLFSGHTSNWVITASMVSRYSNYSWYAVAFWVFNLGGTVSLLFLREHYLSDILTGFFISKLVFWCYHLFFDSHYLRYWFPGARVILSVDDKSEYVTVDGKRVRAWIPGKTTRAYTRLYEWLKWLDGE